jgi:hypothetical protein
MSGEIMSLESLKERISSFYSEEKQAANGNPDNEAISGIKDPAEQGGASDPQKHDGDDAGKQNLPAAGLSNSNTEGENNIPGGTSGEASGKEPNGAGEGGHSASDGDSKDEAVKTPTDPNVAKTANKAKNLADAIRASLGIDEDSEKSAEHEESDPFNSEEKAAEEKAAEEQTPEEIASDFAQEQDAYRKIATLVMDYEEGRQLVNELADREFGKEAASQLINEADYVSAVEQEVAAAEMEGAYAAEELMKNASEEDIADMQKMAVIHTDAASKLEYDFELEAYDAGAKQAAAAMDAGGELPMGGEGTSLEDVAAVIEQLVASGQIDEQTAAQILQELAGGEMGGMPPGAEEEAAMMEALGKGASAELEKLAAFEGSEVANTSEVDALKKENEDLKQKLEASQPQTEEQ